MRWQIENNSILNCKILPFLSLRCFLIKTLSTLCSCMYDIYIFLFIMHCDIIHTFLKFSWIFIFEVECISWVGSFCHLLRLKQITCIVTKWPCLQKCSQDFGLYWCISCEVTCELNTRELVWVVSYLVWSISVEFVRVVILWWWEATYLGWFKGHFVNNKLKGETKIVLWKLDLK